MSYIVQTRDLTSQYLGYDRAIDTFRVIANTLFTPGLCVQLVSLDLQVYPDMTTVTTTGTAATQKLLRGIVADTWPGFSGSIGAPVYLSPSSSTTARGTVGVDAVVSGYHPAALVDQSGAGAVNITNGVGLLPSRATQGYLQGVTSPIAGAQAAGAAMLPASGIGSTLTAAALAQASQTWTVATPAAGDIVNTVIQTPYTTTAPGTVQTTTYSLTLTSATAASATTAGNAITAFLNAQPSISQYYTAANTAGAVTLTVNTAAAPFQVTFGSGTTVLSAFNISVSGAVANSLTTSGSVTGAGGTTYSAGGANFASGTGYKGLCPMLVQT